MVFRALPLFGAALALALFVSQPVFAADEKAHEGTVVKVAAHKVTLTFKGDTKKHTHEVAKGAKITLDGKTAHLKDLKKGYHVKVVMDDHHRLTKITAHSKKK